MSSFLTPNSLASRWSLAPNTLKQWRWNGKGPLYLKINGRVLYRLNDIEQFEQEKLRFHTSSMGV